MYCTYVEQELEQLLSGASLQNVNASQELVPVEKADVLGVQYIEHSAKGEERRGEEGRVTGVIIEAANFVAMADLTVL